MSFRHLIGESFFDYFHFDSKFFRTIIPLLVKPGKLTAEFMDGKRKTYVEPFKLFLVISVIYFLLLPLGGEPNQDQERTTSAAFPERAQQTGLVQQKKYSIDQKKYSIDGVPVTVTGRDSMRREIDSIGLKAYVNKRWPQYGAVIKLFIRQGLKIILYAEKSFTTTLEHTASKMIFLLIPVFALLLKLVYRKTQRLYYEHLIFSLHLHAFIFLALTVTLLIGFVVEVNLLILVAIFLAYLFFALKRYYGERTGRSLGKLSLLSLLYLIVALPVFMVLLTLVAVFLV